MRRLRRREAVGEGRDIRRNSSQRFKGNSNGQNLPICLVWHRVREWWGTYAPCACISLGGDRWACVCYRHSVNINSWKSGWTQAIALPGWDRFISAVGIITGGSQRRRGTRCISVIEILSFAWRWSNFRRAYTLLKLNSSWKTLISSHQRMT